jgi:hypothetical protein
MTDIKILLDDLSNLRSALDVITLEKQKAIDSILTPEIKAKIAEIEIEFAGKGEVATEKANILEAEIKELVKAGAKTIKGSFLMAVFAIGRISWDSKGLDGFALTHPEILYMRKEGDPSVSIRRI